MAQTQVGSPAPPGHVPALDGLRTLAVAAVMAFHVSVPFTTLGMLGVDLFFVLSGFLITTLLLDEHGKTGTISPANFWARRFLRLMPAYWLYALGVTLAIGLGWGAATEHGGWTPAAYVRSIWLYYVNYAPQGGIWSHQLMTIHLWSLAVEEQFYLIWPPLLILGLRLRLAEPLAWTIASVILVRNLIGVDYQLIRLESRGFAIVLGCAVALRLFASPSLVRMIAKPIAGIVATAVALVLIAAGTLAVDRDLVPLEALFPVLATVLAVVFAVIVANLWYGRGGPFAAVLALPPLVAIGRISYGMYLYHFLARALTWDVLLARVDLGNRWANYGLRIAVYTGLTYLIALASYRLIERPFLRLKSRFRAGQPDRIPSREPALAPGAVVASGQGQIA